MKQYRREIILAVVVFLVACSMIFRSVLSSIQNSIFLYDAVCLPTGREYSLQLSTASVGEFYRVAKESGSDKVTTHNYEVMYSMFLAPHRQSKVKLFEIGLGCDMEYGPGASVKLWHDYLPNVELWEAEYDEACVRNSTERGLLKNVNTVTGDQGDPMTLRKWIMQTGGDFDFIIDDGGHKNSQIFKSFIALWPSLKRGGLYFIEDLQVGRRPFYEDTHEEHIMADVIQEWIQQLLLSRAPIIDDKTENASKRHPIPPDVSFIFCQLESCVVGKRP